MNEMPIATTDASCSYHERTGVEIARSLSTATDGTVASLMRDGAYVVSTVSTQPVQVSQGLSGVSLAVSSRF